MVCGVATHKVESGRGPACPAQPLPSRQYRQLHLTFDSCIGRRIWPARLLKPGVTPSPTPSLPLYRIIIPGWIGGRMVKWLTEITLTEQESTNHYHYYDNRVLPSHVDEKKAHDEGESQPHRRRRIRK